MNDDLLTTLLADAVADVEPADRLEEIRARVQHADRGHRGWWIAGGGAALAVAASVTVVAVTTTPREASTTPPPPLGSTSPSAPATPESTQSTDTATGVETQTYYVGEGPSGLRLFREIRTSSTTDPFAAAVAALMTSPQDPDYRSPWPPGSLISASFDGIGAGGFYSVVLADESLTRRPAGMSEDEARLAVQAVVYTLNRTVGGAPAPVEFYVDHGVVDSVLGVPAERDPKFSGVRKFTEAPVLDTLSRVNLTTPEEGATVSGSTLDVEGVANSFEANVPWLLEDEAGNDVANGAFTATGWMDTKLFPFRGSIDVSSLDPGRYSLIVYTDDPSGGSEGPGASSDSRTVVIE